MSNFNKCYPKQQPYSEHQQYVLQEQHLDHMYNQQVSLPQQQGLENVYNQGQQIPMQIGISQPNRAINFYSRNQAEGPSFTGRASVFGQPPSETSHKEQSRPTISPSSEKISFDRIKSSKSPITKEDRHIEMYDIESSSRSQDDRSRPHERSRSGSRTNRSLGERDNYEHHQPSQRWSRSLSPGHDRSSWGDVGVRGNGNKAEAGGNNSRTAQQQLDRTLNRLQQLEQQQHIQDQLLKDMQIQMEEPSPGKQQEKEPQYYSLQSSNDGRQREMHTPGYGHVGVPQGSDNDPRWRSDHHGGSRGHTRKSSGDFGFSDHTKPSADLVCYRCGRYGHIAADCTETRQKEEVKTCYACRRKGHIAADCTELRGISKCYRCEQPGHLAKDCRVPDYKLNTSTSKCYRCEQPGHLAKDCRVPDSKLNPSTNKCYRCEQPGHLAKDCRVPDSKLNSSTNKCYRCEQPGHLAKDCRVPDSKLNSSALTSKCYRCNQPGHLLKDCRVPDSKLNLINRDIMSRRCYSCEGWGHFQKDCPSASRSAKTSIKGNQTSPISCFLCKGVGHKSKDCYSRRQSTSSARAGVSSKDSKRIDAETTLMVEGIFAFSKTKYPVPEGCMTRLEIDDSLKRQSTLHGIKESDIPAASSQSDTTLSNQAALLVRLNWKSMLYDREVENLFCLLCDQEFSGLKQYQAHVNSKEPHLNLYNVLLNAKCGWAVRTKMLKKICKLPSIFEDPSPGASPKPYPDIKPELLNGEEKKRFFFCRVCHSWGETPLQSHFESQRHKYLYEKQWKCDFCNMYFRNYQDFTKHAKTSIIHREVTAKLVKNEPTEEEDKLGMATTPTIKRCLDDKKSPVLKKKFKYAEEDRKDVMFMDSNTEDEDVDVLGLQFLVPVTGFFCKICNKFYNDAKVTKQKHCRSKQHLSKVKEWYQKNKKSLTSDNASIDKDKHLDETVQNSPTLVIIEDTVEKKDSETKNTIADELQYVGVDGTGANNDGDMKENVEEIAGDGENTLSSTTELFQHTEVDKEKDDSTDVDANCNVALAESKGNLEDANITGESVDEENAGVQIQGYDSILQEDTDMINTKELLLHQEEMNVDVQGVDALGVVADVTKNTDVSMDVKEYGDAEPDFVDNVDSENEDMTSLDEADNKDKTYTAQQVKVDSYEAHESYSEGKNKVDDNEAEGKKRLDDNKANREDADNNVDKETLGGDNVDDANTEIVSGSVDESGTSEMADSVEEKTEGNTKKGRSKRAATVTQASAAKKNPKRGKKGEKSGYKKWRNSVASAFDHFDRGQGGQAV